MKVAALVRNARKNSGRVEHYDVPLEGQCHNAVRRVATRLAKHGSLSAGSLSTGSLSTAGLLRDGLVTF